MRVGGRVEVCVCGSECVLGGVEACGEGVRVGGCEGLCVWLRCAYVCACVRVRMPCVCMCVWPRVACVRACVRVCVCMCV